MYRPAFAACLVLSGVLGLAPYQPASQPPTKPDAQPRLPAGHPQIQAPKPGADWPKADPADVASVDAIVKAFYASIAGDAGQPRQWDRYRSLFVPDARLIAARPGEGNTSGAFFLTVSDYVAANRDYFEKGGFFDTEIARRIEAFGNMTHVWSTYESRRQKDAPQPYVRGINSIQLLKDGERYWIVNVFWEYERPGLSLPEKYTTTPRD
jgi:hypothetical protein